MRFLDLNVTSSGIKFTNLHNNSTDKRQYLNYTTTHSTHTKLSIIYS